MTTKYYRPKRKADLVRHLETEHAGDISARSAVAVAEGMVVRELTWVHDRIHYERGGYAAAPSLD